MLLLLAAAFTATLQAEARDGKITPAAPVSRELDATLAARAEDRVDEFIVGVAYNPRLTLIDDGSSTAFHDARVSLALVNPDGFRFEVGEQVTYGRIDLSPLASQTVPVSVAAIRFVNSASTQSTLRLAQPITRRLSWNLSAAYFYGGGVGALDHSVLPRTREPTVSAALSYALSRLDVAAATLNLRDSWADNGIVSNTASLIVSLAHSFTRSTSGSLGAGVGWSSTRLSAVAQPVGGLLPAFDASLRVSEPIRGQILTASLRASVAPALDLLTGTAYINAGGSAEIVWAPTHELDLRASVGFARVVEGALDGSKTLQADASVGYKVTRDFALTTGLRATDVQPRGQFASALEAGEQWTAYLRAGWTLGTRTR